MKPRRSCVALFLGGLLSGPVTGQQVLTEDAYLKASNPGTGVPGSPGSGALGDYFGSSVGLCGDLAVLGAPYEDSSSPGVNGAQDDLLRDSGATYVLRRGPAGWSEEAFLKAANLDIDDQFGGSVAIFGTTIVVGASLEASGSLVNPANNQAKGAGAVYVFESSGSSWAQTDYVKASNPQQGDRFGWSAAIDGDTLIVGAYREDSAATGINGDQSDNSAPQAGAAYVFVRSGTTWAQQAYLKPSNTEAGAWFGFYVDVSGDRAYVGAPLETVPGNNLMGAAYVFARNGSTWAEELSVRPNSPPPFANLLQGAIAGDTLAVFEENLSPGLSRVRIFVHDTGSWTEQASLTSGIDDTIEEGLDLQGDRLVLRRLTSSMGNTIARAQVHERRGTVWSELASLERNLSDQNDSFGLDLALDGGLVVAGAFAEDSALPNDPMDDSALDAGAAYAFELDAIDVPIVLCTAKTNSLGCVPQIAAFGLPGSECRFEVEATQVLNARNGLLFYGYNSIPGVPFLGGTLCAGPPLRRMAIQNAGGSPPPTVDCSGVFSFDFGAWIASGADPLLLPGTSVTAQWWSRDPLQADGTGVGLTDAVQFQLP